ncbi:hypothetical protein BDV26DRAFT_33638 [Aspergillus bertholletiae]|uniref:Uncharacterized protein n=1 Tax=Aspergillus bertholletiae TaxID=1226010 RepID=A0A5N7B0W3_9EURO|nr:hypothetical protein BDV26DRAFT_33638 [Aspergillus bertholletiae]
MLVVTVGGEWIGKGRRFPFADKLALFQHALSSTSAFLPFRAFSLNTRNTSHAPDFPLLPPLHHFLSDTIIARRSVLLCIVAFSAGHLHRISNSSGNLSLKISVPSRSQSSCQQSPNCIADDLTVAAGAIRASLGQTGHLHLPIPLRRNFLSPGH